MQYMTDPLQGEQLPLLEVHQQLDQLSRAYPAAKLLIDLARDATNEAVRQQTQLTARLRRSRRRQRHLRKQRAELLDGIAGFPLQLGLPLESACEAELLQRFTALREREFAPLAEQLHRRAGRGELRDFRRLLADRILLRGQRTLIEAYLRKPHTRLDLLLDRLAQHLSHRLVRRLARPLGQPVDQTHCQAVHALAASALQFIAAMLAHPGVLRLSWPRPGDIFDPAMHERGSGKPSQEPRRVLAVLFPGLVRRTSTPHLLARAVVATQRNTL
jgi:hypothetical protein